MPNHIEVYLYACEKCGTVRVELNDYLDNAILYCCGVVCNNTSVIHQKLILQGKRAVFINTEKD